MQLSPTWLKVPTQPYPAVSRRIQLPAAAWLHACVQTSHACSATCTACMLLQRAESVLYSCSCLSLLSELCYSTDTQLPTATCGSAL
jgi:hypothetical protein